MAGTIKGALKSKLGLKGDTKPGEMISRMNVIKGNTLKNQVKLDSTIKKII